MNTTPARLLAATSLVAAALLSAVSVALQPEFAADPAARLAAIAAAGTSATVSLLAFAVSQLPFLVAVVAIARLAHAGAPRLAATGGALATVGGFGHAVFGGIGLSYLAMSVDAGDRAVFADAVTRVESGPALVFMAGGMLGTVLGLVLLGVALFRSRVVPRWIPVALWAFLVTEFALTSLTAWAAPAASVLFVAAFTGIAVRLVRGEVPLRHLEREHATSPSAAR
jgi:hypothetical protein